MPYLLFVLSQIVLLLSHRNCCRIKELKLVMITCIANYCEEHIYNLNNKSIIIMVFSLFAHKINKIHFQIDWNGDDLKKYKKYILNLGKDPNKTYFKGSPKNAILCWASDFCKIWWSCKCCYKIVFEKSQLQEI